MVFLALRHAGHDAVLGLEALEGGDANRPPDVVVVGTVARAVLVELAPGDQRGPGR